MKHVQITQFISLKKFNDNTHVIDIRFMTFCPNITKQKHQTLPKVQTKDKGKIIVCKILRQCQKNLQQKKKKTKNRK